MAEYTVDVGTLDEKSQSQAVDLLQKIQALDGAMAEVQTALSAIQSDMNAKTSALQAEKNKAIDALRALRSATVR